MTEYEAFKRWHQQEKKLLEVKKQFRNIELTIEGLELDMFHALVEQYSHDKAFLRVLRRFRGRDQHAWDLSCDLDGRIRKLANNLGWDRMYRLIKAVRKVYEEGE